MSFHCEDRLEFTKHCLPMFSKNYFQENFKLRIQLFFVDTDFSEDICSNSNILVCIAFIRKLRCSLQLSNTRRQRCFAFRSTTLNAFAAKLQNVMTLQRAVSEVFLTAGCWEFNSQIQRWQSCVIFKTPVL